MKKLRHYDKNIAVVLSVFGSSEMPAMKQYHDLEEHVKQNVPTDIELRIAISSKTIMKKLEKQGHHYLTLLEQLANLDRLGYKKVIVASINLFPTGEHEYIQKVVDTFKNVLIAKYEITAPLFTKAKQTNDFLCILNNKLRTKYDISNILFIAHGAANLASPGNSTFAYIREYLKVLNPRNYLYTIEGAFPYDQCHFLREVELENKNFIEDNRLLVVPLLLVAGNHFKNDIIEIKEALNEEFTEVIIPECSCDTDGFSLLKISATLDYFVDEIKETIERINC